MKNDFFEIDGLIINKWDIGEADRYIDIFTDLLGRVSVLVKGIRKSKRREQIAIDIMTRSKFILYKKNDKYILSKFSLLDPYLEIKENMNNFEVGLCIIGILNKMTVPQENDKRLYDITLKTLGALKENKDPKKKYLILAYYIYFIIKNEGLEYSLDNDVNSVTEDEKLILSCIASSEINTILDNNSITVHEIKNVIYIYEKYIRYHLDIDLALNKYLMGVANDQSSQNN